MEDRSTALSEVATPPRATRMSWLVAGLRRAAALRLLEPEVLGLDQLVRRGDVCLDIGAAYGMYSYPLAQLVGPEGAVHSFEPQPRAHALLRAGRALAGADRIRITRSGVGRASGEAEIELPIRLGFPIHGHAHLVDGASQRAPQTWHSRSKRIRVPMTTVDEVCAARGIERVHFIKVDVEGVVRGAAAVIRRDRPSLLLEVEDRHLTRSSTTAAAFTDELLELGYAMHAWRGDRWSRADRVERGTRNYLFASDAAWDRPR